MTDCGLLNLNVARCLGEMWAGAGIHWPWYAPYLGWGLLIIAALLAINLAQKFIGTPGVIAAASAIAFFIGMLRGRSDQAAEDKSKAPKPAPLAQKPRQGTIFDIFNKKQ